MVSLGGSKIATLKYEDLQHWGRKWEFRRPEWTTKGPHFLQTHTSKYIATFIFNYLATVCKIKLHVSVCDIIILTISSFSVKHSLLVFKDIFNGLPGPLTWRYVVVTTAHVVPTLTPVTLPAWRTSARALVINHRCHAAILTEVIAHGHCKLFKQRPVLKQIH